MLSGSSSAGITVKSAVVLSPIYWAMMSIAAIRALVQLLVAPSFWEKSVHGLEPSPTVDLVPDHAGR